MDVKINLILSLLIFCIFANSNSLPQRSQISSNPEILTKVQGLINQVRNLHNNVNKVKCQNAGRKLNALGSKAYDVFLCFGDLFPRLNISFPHLLFYQNKQICPLLNIFMPVPGM